MIKLNLQTKIPETIAERRAFLKSKLQKFKGKKYKCPALSNADVFVNSDSIRETVAHASRTKKSTLCALYLDKIIKEASFVKTTTPKIGTQTTKFKFIELMILEVEVENLGNVKLTVGVRRNNKHIQYCVTVAKK